MSDWLVVALGGLGSYLLRMSMIASDHLRLPARWESSAELIAPAAFTALALSSLAASVVSAGAIAAAAPIVVATLVAIALPARTGRPYTSLLGLPAYWLTSAALAALA